MSASFQNVQTSATHQSLVLIEKTSLLLAEKLVQLGHSFLHGLVLIRRVYVRIRLVGDQEILVTFAWLVAPLAAYLSVIVAHDAQKV